MSAAEVAGGEEAEATTGETLIGNGQGMLSSTGEYLAALETASRDFHENGARHYLENYYGEFFDYDSARDYYEEGQTTAAANVGSSHQGQNSIEEDTAASTVTYLTALSVQHLTGDVRQMQLDENEMDIPFSEQDDPPDSLIDRCPNNC